MTDWHFETTETWYREILKGTKSVECCPHDPAKDLLRVQRMDYAFFHLLDEDYQQVPNYPAFHRLINRVNVYPTIEAALKKEGVANVFPGTQTIEEGVSHYHAFPGYEQKTEHGIIVFNIGAWF